MPWTSRKLPWSKVQRLAFEHFDGAALLATLEGKPFRVTIAVQGFGLRIYQEKRELAAIHQCMRMEDDPDPHWWSVKIEGVMWRLAPNDLRHLIARRGLHTCTYVPDEVQAFDLMMKTFARRNRVSRPTLVLPMMPGRQAR